MSAGAVGGTGSPPRRIPWILLAAGLAAGVVWLARPEPRASGPLAQEAYVWQRRPGPEVRQAAARAGDLTRLVFLAAEADPRTEPPRITRVPLDPAVLASLPQTIGLALRIGPLPGRFADRPQTADRLLRLAETVVRDARAAGLAVAELELDYDCPESRLADYAAWVARVRRAVQPTPMVITALPAWLSRRRDFARLVEQTDGFVLQVHSFERPQGPEAPLVLCDPRAARAAVEEAARFRRPFRVALPTYGYVAAWSREGRFLGLAAEGPGLAWPRGAVLRTAEADPAAMAGLVAGWRRDRPRALAGILWYRLPAEGDRRAWPEATFRAVRQGRAPRPKLRAVARVQAEDAALVDIALANAGEAPAPWPAAVRLQWDPSSSLLASDGLAGYRIHEEGPGRLVLERRGKSPPPLPPGAERAVGWLRLDRAVRVEAALAR